MRYARSIAIAERHEALLELVKSGSFSSPELAKELAVSEPTIYRDILFLKRQGYRIEAVKLSAGWAYKLTNEHHALRTRQGQQP